MALTNSEKRKVRAAWDHGGDTSLGWFGRTVLALWAGTSFFVANYLAVLFYLVFRYGVARVFSEHIRVVSAPFANKYDPWPLSNGDQMSYADISGLFPIEGILWLALAVAGYAVVKYISAKKRQAELEKALDAA